MIVYSRIFKSSVSYVIVLVLLACNSNNKREADSNRILDSIISNKPQASISEKRNPDSANDTVVIKNMQFLPADLHVKKGATVVWINRDIVVHDATEYPDKQWTSGPLQMGSSWKMEIDKSYDYFCSIHITMKGKITVDP